MNAAKKLGKALHQNGNLLLLDVRHNNLSKEAQRVLSTSAAARPRSSTGDHMRPSSFASSRTRRYWRLSSSRTRLATS